MYGQGLQNPEDRVRFSPIFVVNGACILRLQNSLFPANGLVFPANCHRTTHLLAVSSAAARGREGEGEFVQNKVRLMLDGLLFVYLIGAGSSHNTALLLSLARADARPP